MKLDKHYIEKPWGRTALPAIAGEGGGARIGEVWFGGPDGAGLPLLLKYIFTSERLSIQVHPSESHARAAGLPHGKSECWYILDAQPGATIGLGLKEEISSAALRAAALDGSIEDLIDWKPAAKGDFFLVPGGTIHSIGAGISLIEVQQNSDVTYRLYDYGRPRELHLEEAISAAQPGPVPSAARRETCASGNELLVDGPHFTVFLCRESAGDPADLRNRDRWIMPLSGAIDAASQRIQFGECLFLPAGEPLTGAEGDFLLATAGSMRLGNSPRVAYFPAKATPPAAAARAIASGRRTKSA